MSLSRTIALAGLTTVLLCTGAYGQVLKDSGSVDTTTGPIWMLDGIRVSRGRMDSLQIDDVACAITRKVPRGDTLTAEETKRGVISILTKPYARIAYWRFLSDGSRRYARLVPTPEKDSMVIYIVNGEVNKKDLPYALIPVDNMRLDRLTIISKRRLRKRLGITGKRFGVEVEIEAK
jgi:hypothetical protein